MAIVTDQIKEEVRQIVLEFFAEECEVEISDINDSTHIFDDLDGDSLMFLELIEIFKKKYNLNIELKTIGKFNVKNPVRTIGELIHMQLLIIEHENNIISFSKI
jgi:acyl carrier protein